MNKFLITTFFLRFGTSTYAQGWVIDDVSKEDSGGPFSGILGFLLFLGIIWLLGYLFDKKNDESGKLRKDSSNSAIKSTSIKKDGSNLEKKQTSANESNKIIGSTKKKDVSELIPQIDSCYLYFHVINGKDFVDLTHYYANSDDGFGAESYSIHSDGIDYSNIEHYAQDLSTIRERGLVVTKDYFETWRKKIDKLKLDLERLFINNTQPYGKEWNKGDYLYMPVKEILIELNRKLAEENNEPYGLAQGGYNGPEFSILHVTNVDKDIPEGFYISISEDYISCENEDGLPNSLKYYFSDYKKAQLISKEGYENAKLHLKRELRSMILEIKNDDNHLYNNDNLQT